MVATPLFFKKEIIFGPPSRSRPLLRHMVTPQGTILESQANLI